LPVLPASSLSAADLFRLDGQTAIVTGGLGRLGSQYARALTSAGASVALFDVATRVGPTVQALVEADAPITIHALDATRRAEVNREVARVVERFGAPTILVNNAGLGASPANAALDTARFEQYPESAWDAMMESHLKSAFVVSQSFVAAFRDRSTARRDGGSIINVSSTYGVVSPDQSVYAFRRRDGGEYFKPVGYSVAKGGMLNFTRWLAEYCAPFGIRVNTLVPGGVRESEHAQEFVAEYEKRTPLGRMANDDDYNGAIVFLASRASAYMTGATLVIDGGWTAR
jgi:NAD(P)-dependent dehydrogenase (short-subunit alcohol dehydrogenase family)